MPACRRYRDWPAKLGPTRNACSGFSDIGSLVEPDVRRVLVEPVEAEGAGWEAAAVDRILAATEGYPYFLQEFGKQAWNVAEGGVIAASDIDGALALALDDLDHGFFRARIDKTTDAERDYLRAMATLGGAGPTGRATSRGTWARPPPRPGPFATASSKGGCASRLAMEN